VCPGEEGGKGVITDPEECLYSVSERRGKDLLLAERRERKRRSAAYLRKKRGEFLLQQGEVGGGRRGVRRRGLETSLHKGRREKPRPLLT